MVELALGISATAAFVRVRYRCKLCASKYKDKNLKKNLKFTRKRDLRIYFSSYPTLHS